MAARDPDGPSKSVPWWAVTMAAVASVAVLAFAVRSGGQVAQPAAVAPPPPGGLVEVGEPARGDSSLAAASATVSIEMYSAAWCSACSRAKAWMRDQNISYHEIDVDQRTGAMGQLAVLNPRRTLPTFDVQGEVLVGFEPGALESAIRGAAR
ncbi:MAG: glutaredoxin family protein [Deltaproteobacteria bacterium]|jgi:glutaredoxin